MSLRPRSAKTITVLSHVIISNFDMSDSEEDVLNELEDDIEENEEQDIDEELLNTVADDLDNTEDGDEVCSFRHMLVY